MCRRRLSLGDNRRFIRLRLMDGEQVLYHKTDIVASDNEVMSDKMIKKKMGQHALAMCKAYTLMQVRHLELNNKNFENEIRRVMEEGELEFSRRDETLYERLLRYIEESHRDGVMGSYRYRQMKGKAGKLYRFLAIHNILGISAKAFDLDLLMRFRQFVADEYLYVSNYPHLYPKGRGKRQLKQRRRSNTVVHDLKALKAFFNELENSGEIERSPFSRISNEKRKSLMHVMYDEPYFLRADEFRHTVSTTVPPDLQTTKDIFILNCSLGCRIGDLKRFTMDKFSISPDGIPYIHYIPSKTSSIQKTNKEIMTPLIDVALEIVQRTHFSFNGPHPEYERQVYNKNLRRLLQYCGIDRRVCVFDPKRGDNIYVPICDIATSKLARKTHVDMLNKVQINYYAAGLHHNGSEAVFRYTSLELADRYALLKAAFEGC